MAINSISSSRLTASLDGVQAANLRDSAAKRNELRTQQAGERQRAERAENNGEARAVVSQRVEKNEAAQRNRAEQADKAAAGQRSELKSQDARAEQQRAQAQRQDERQGEQASSQEALQQRRQAYQQERPSAVGGKIDTTA